MSICAFAPTRVVAGLFVLGTLAVSAQAADVAGSADHPLVPRYQGAEIIDYDFANYDAYSLFVEAATARGGAEENLAHTLPLEGEVTEITYRLPEGRSPLEVMRNYVLALDALGFETLFQCETEACGGRNFNHAAVPYTLVLGDNYVEQRFLAARLRQGDSELYVAVYVTRATGTGGENHDRTIVKLDIVERVGMELNIEILDSQAINEELMLNGHVALQAVLFEFDSAVLRPEAADQLREMAAYLAEHPGRTFMIVGHTDNAGEVGYNMQLSQARAEAVVAALAGDYSVDGARLIPVGVGMSAPIVSNASEDGRSQNRRVELVVK